MNIIQLSFEDALKELETIVKRLEEGRANLDEAVAIYERGALLKAHCEDLLKAARLKIQEVLVSKEGAVSTQTSSLEETL